MKNKTVLIVALFVSFLIPAQAQKYKLDTQLDGYTGAVKMVDQKVYDARVNGDVMEHGDLMEHIQTLYTSKGYRKSMTFLSADDGKIICRTRYKHDGFGLLTLEQIVDPAESVIGRTYYLYNQNNILSETYVEDAERQIENRVLMIYNAQGRLSQRSYNDPFNEIYKREVYSYGPDGNIQRTIVYDRTKKKVQEWKFEYDEHNQPISQTVYEYTEAEPEVFITLFAYKYDNKGNWIQKTEYSLDKDRSIPVCITERNFEYFE